MVKLAIFASGNGTNAEAIIKYFAHSESINIVLVLSNRADAGVHARAKQLGVPSESYTRAQFNEGCVILERLRAVEADYIILAGFLCKIPNLLLEAYPDRIVNIHPALLPKFGGKGMYGDHVHEAVVAAGETESGITIHLVNEHYDSGRTLFQAHCDVLPTDTPHDVAAKVHALEYAYFPQTIEAWIKGEI